MLGGIQQQLQDAYGTLAKRRSELGYPVYALEHGLSSDEIETTWLTASEAIRYEPPSSSHWLVWCALASEAGYRYSGDEFWPALERRRGEWRNNENRQRLRSFYRRFNADFGGPEPRGRWAGHFNIIAWPISGAILPLYLQAHFAQHLFELKYDLPRVLHADGDAVGDLLLRRYDGHSSRFLDFLQQTGLTTQIVLALRDEAHAPEITRIQPAVLRKIVSDLESKREAGHYLRDARRVMDTTTIKVASPLQSKAATPAGSGSAGDIGDHSRFRLLARALPNGRYALGVRLPDYRRAGVTRDLVSGQRVQFVGDSEHSQPASILLAQSAAERPLDAFPPPNADLVVTLDSSSKLAALLAGACRIEERPIWVLRRHLDGAYREIRGGHVRSRQEYVILTRGSPSKEAVNRAGLSPTELLASGVEAFTLSTPTVLSVEQRAALLALGLSVATGVTVEPIGLNPRPGPTPSWLTTEPVLIAASADIDITGVAVSLDGAEPLVVPCSDAAAYIAIEQAEPGRHTLAISPILPGGAGWHSPPETFEFEIVPAQPWLEAMQGKSGFRVILEPADATFEMVVSGDATVTAYGPPGRNVHWSFAAYDAAGHAGTAMAVGATRVGDAPAKLKNLIDQASKKFSDQIDEAYQIDIRASLEELGAESKRFPRVVEPLRWKFEPTTGTARLIDETDHDELPTLSAYPLADPIEKSPLALDAALAGLKPDGEGALLVARYKDLVQTIFVSAPKSAKFHDFAALGAKQTLSLPAHRGQAAIRIVDGMRRWEKAKPVGQLALVRRDMTVRDLRAELVGLCCGREFAGLILSTPPALDRAQSKVGGSQGFGSRMRRNEWPVDYEAAVGAFVHYAQHYGIEADERLARLALTLAYRPLKLRLEAIDDKKEFLASLLERRQLLRGAFLAHAVSRQPTAVALQESA